MARTKRTRIQVLVATGTLNIDAARGRASQIQPAGQLMIVAGIVRSPISRCWHLGVSRQGAPLSWVSVHRLKRDAEQQADVIFDVGKRGDLRDDSVWQELLDELSSRSEGEFGDPYAEPRAISHRPRIQRSVKVDQSVT